MNQPVRTGWRYFPHWTIGLLFVVVAVNGFMAYEAVGSFPGTATDADFDTSNRYDKVLADEARQAQLGWNVEASAAERRAVITLATREGAKLEGARVVAIAQRPAGGQADQRLQFRATSPGRYVADTALPEEGQWQLQIAVTEGGRQYRATRRILVP